MADEGCKVIKDQFSELGRQIAAELVGNVLDAAQAIEGAVKSDRWSRRIPVRLDTKDPTLITVRVGSPKGFFAGFMEYGTIDQPARPVVVPAAEAQRARFLARAKALGDKLHG